MGSPAPLCKRCDRPDCASIVHDHLDPLVPCSACQGECDGAPVDWRDRALKAEAAIREWIEARIAAQAARCEEARISTAIFKGQKAPPKRMPKNAVMFHDLLPDDQAQINAELAAEMAPLDAAEAVTKAAVGNAVTLYPVEEVRPLYAPRWGSDGRYNPAIPYSRRSSQRQRRKLRRRGGR